ncbi:hypothetical protein HDU79_002553 [Rhizoclosmatium sp. JEL0117]|nr:hypothetical protein HDU79_002553 [Rhizoclosmatium sp. JEL0117]
MTIPIYIPGTSSPPPESELSQPQPQPQEPTPFTTHNNEIESPLVRHGTAEPILPNTATHHRNQHNHHDAVTIGIATAILDWPSPHHPRNIPTPPTHRTSFSISSTRHSTEYYHPQSHQIPPRDSANGTPIPIRSESVTSGGHVLGAMPVYGIGERDLECDEEEILSEEGDEDAEDDLEIVKRGRRSSSSLFMEAVEVNAAIENG